MKKPVVIYPSIGFLLAVGLFFSLTTFFSDAFGQEQPQRDRLVLPTSSHRAVPAKPSLLATAAIENTKLRSGLRWEFAGKAQTGWQIYVPLVAHTVGTESDPGTPDFAEAVAVWQAKSGLEPTGMIDRQTLEAFTKFWQSKRLFKTGNVVAGQMTMAPNSDFYDPTRDLQLRHLDSETYSAYKQMIAAAQKEAGLDLLTYGNGNNTRDERFLKIISAFRSPEYQAMLRKKEPNAGRGALAKVSAHSTGRAIDIFVGGEPVATRDDNRLVQVQTPAYKWLVKNAARFGFVPYFYEPWHWEYVARK